jgi:hypothetical protein
MLSFAAAMHTPPWLQIVPRDGGTARLNLHADLESTDTLAMIPGVAHANFVVDIREASFELLVFLREAGRSPKVIDLT